MQGHKEKYQGQPGGKRSEQNEQKAGHSLYCGFHETMDKAK